MTAYSPDFDSTLVESFLSDDDKELTRRLLSDGYVIRPVQDADALERIRGTVTSLAARHLGIDAPDDGSRFLNALHEHVDVGSLNDLRLFVFDAINREPWFRPAYFSLARDTLERLVGNELAMQRRINLSIQLPADDSSLLPAHTDTLSGDSPFEVVAWLPLVDCRRTKSMFILPPEPNAELMRRLPDFRDKGIERLTAEYETAFIWLDIRYGEVLVFNQNLFHGNVVNAEPETRWSMNCRFKGLFTPYADKRLGEFFEPITLRGASRIGLGYAGPDGFGGREEAS